MKAIPHNGDYVVCDSTISPYKSCYGWIVDSHIKSAGEPIIYDILIDHECHPSEMVHLQRGNFAVLNERRFKPENG